MPSKTSKERLLGAQGITLVNGAFRIKIPQIWFSLNETAKRGADAWFYLDEAKERIVMSPTENRKLGVAAPRNPYTIYESGHIMIPLDLVKLMDGIGETVMLRVDVEKNLVIEKTA